MVVVDRGDAPAVVVVTLLVVLLAPDPFDTARGDFDDAAAQRFATAPESQVLDVGVGPFAISRVTRVSDGAIYFHDSDQVFFDSIGGWVYSPAGAPTGDGPYEKFRQQTHRRAVVRVRCRVPELVAGISAPPYRSRARTGNSAVICAPRTRTSRAGHSYDNGAMGSQAGDFALTMDELRVVARFAADSAETVLPDFEAELPDDPRPRAALAAALTFANGAPRSNLQRTTAVAAHRASKEATSETARLAAQACGDAAAAAYLHPIAKPTQVGHILRSASCAARVAELKAGGDEAAATSAITSTAQHATPILRDVLNRYPPVPVGTGRLAQIMSALDASLRDRH